MPVGASCSLPFGVFFLLRDLLTVLLLTSQGGSGSHNVLSLLNKVPLSDLGSLLWTLSLYPSTASWLICSPFMSHHDGFHGGLPPRPCLLWAIWESLYSSHHSSAGSYTSSSVSNHLSHCSAHSNAEVEHMQYNPARQKGPSVAGTLFRCCLSVHRLLLSCPGSVSPWMTTLKPWSFRSSCLHERWWGVLSGL